MLPNMTLPELLFELSSSIRLDMLRALETAPLSFSKIVEQMDLNSSEASRQIERLAGMKLIEKFVEGGYSITPFGKLVLSFLPGIDVVLKNRDFFLSHDTSPIPQELIMRFGELSSAVFIDGTVEIMNFMEKRMLSTKKYHYVMSDGVIRLLVPYVVEKVGSGIEFNMIFPETCKKELSGLIDEYADIEESMRTIKIRTLESILVGVGISDYGGTLKLPDFDGNVDHSTMLIGSDPAFCRWCRDLFMYYWKQAKPI
jgi:predicted transcriptional regulator